VIADPATSPETRAKLELVRMAAVYAERELDLDVGDSYTAFSQVDRDTLLLVVTASQKDAFRAHTWWFPIVGRVPYKGYLQPGPRPGGGGAAGGPGAGHARATGGRVQHAGLVQRPAAEHAPEPGRHLAGVHGDPRADSTTRCSSGARSAFNESFANFVGDVGAAEMFCAVEGDDGPRCQAARDSWATP
jgi:predicted aminopeptidase